MAPDDLERTDGNTVYSDEQVAADTDEGQGTECTKTLVMFL